MLNEIKEGLAQPQKKLPSKFFYDERGSQLFEQITCLDEYYLTRTEIAILERNINAISASIGSAAMLIELGSGSSRKTRLLLDCLPDLSAYIPVDISEEYLLKVVNRLRKDYPKITIIPVFADYTSCFYLPNFDAYNKQVVFFPGSTIGNFRPRQVRSFLDNLADVTDSDSGLLIGVDLKKDKKILEAAYNDKEGVTAEFNKNMLVHLNRKFGTGFEVEEFEHRAFYNEKEGRIEMHLVSKSEQEIVLEGEQFHFAEGESIHTENSYKYSLDELEELVSNRYSVEQVWTDDRDYFSLQFLSRK